MKFRLSNDVYILDIYKYLDILKLSDFKVYALNNDSFTV